MLLLKLVQGPNCPTDGRKGRLFQQNPLFCSKFKRYYHLWKTAFWWIFNYSANLFFSQHFLMVFHLFCFHTVFPLPSAVHASLLPPPPHRTGYIMKGRSPTLYSPWYGMVGSAAAPAAWPTHHTESRNHCKPPHQLSYLVLRIEWNAAAATFTVGETIRNPGVNRYHTTHTERGTL